MGFKPTSRASRVISESRADTRAGRAFRPYSRTSRSPWGGCSQRWKRRRSVAKRRKKNNKNKESRRANKSEAEHGRASKSA